MLTLYVTFTSASVASASVNNQLHQCPLQKIAVSLLATSQRPLQGTNYLHSSTRIICGQIKYPTNAFTHNSYLFCQSFKDRRNDEFTVHTLLQM